MTDKTVAAVRRFGRFPEDVFDFAYLAVDGFWHAPILRKKDQKPAANPEPAKLPVQVEQSTYLGRPCNRVLSSPHCNNVSDFSLFAAFVGRQGV